MSDCQNMPQNCWQWTGDGTGGIPTVCLCDKTENYPIRLLDMLRSVMYVDGYIYIYIHTVMQIDTDAISDHCMRIEGRIHIGQFCWSLKESTLKSSVFTIRTSLSEASTRVNLQMGSFCYGTPFHPHLPIPHPPPQSTQKMLFSQKLNLHEWR